MSKAKNISKKMLIIIISITVSVCLLACVILAVFNSITIDSPLFLYMPTWYICHRIEKEIPIGSDADTVIAFLKTQELWYDSEIIKGQEPTIYEGSVSRRLANQIGLYSFSKLDHRKTEHGAYYRSSSLGTAFENVPDTSVFSLIRYEVFATFIFDENMELIDIAVWISLDSFI